VFPKLNKSQDDIRKQIVSDMNKKPGAVNPGPQAVTQKATGTRSSEDIIREKFAQLGG
jgi:hypothetical protein